MDMQKVGSFYTAEETISYIYHLMLEGFECGQISVVSKAVHDMEVITQTMQVSEKQAISHRFLGILSGILAGLGGIFIIPHLLYPGIGHILAAAPIASYVYGETHEDLKHLLASYGCLDEEAEMTVSELELGKIVVLIELN